MNKKIILFFILFLVFLISFYFFYIKINNDNKILVLSGVKQKNISSKLEVKNDIDINYTNYSIDKVKNNSELKKINPLFFSDSKFTSEEFFEYNKNIIKLGLLLSEIKEQGYIDLKKEQSLINDGKEIWTEDIIKINEEIERIVNIRKNNLPSYSQNMKDLSIKKSILIKEFQKSEEYKNYIISKKDRLSEIDILLSNYYSLEILDLKNKIDNFILSNTGSIISNNSK